MRYSNNNKNVRRSNFYVNRRERSLCQADLFLKTLVYICHLKILFNRTSPYHIFLLDITPTLLFLQCFSSTLMTSRLPISSLTREIRHILRHHKHSFYTCPPVKVSVYISPTATGLFMVTGTARSVAFSSNRTSPPAPEQL